VLDAAGWNFERRRDCFAIEEHQLRGAARDRDRTGHISERPVRRYAELRGARCSDRSPRDTFNDRHRPASDFEPLRVERNRKDDAAKRVHEVAGRKIACVAAAFDERLPLTGRERLDNDLGLVPPVPLLFASVNSTTFSPGSICGPDATSSGSTLTIASGVPPFGETRITPFSPPNTIPSAPQRIPIGLPDDVIVTAAPPATAIRLIV
jgi:hypothetical protein